MEQRFAKRVALVTGGASGMGAATAARLQREGATVASLDLSPSAPDGVLALAGDVSVAADVDAAVRRVTDELGPIDILVAAAGIAGKALRIAEVDDAEWRRIMSIILDGVFHANRAVVPGMVSRGSGRIVNIGSIAGLEGNPMAPAYSAAKAGVIALTKAIGRDLATSGVIVNCVAPGLIDTPALNGPDKSQEYLDYAISKIPMGRLGTVDEAASLICWLASDECAFSTGAVYDISGGRTVY